MVTLIESPVPYLLAGIVAVAILAIAFFNTGRGIFLIAIAGAVLLTLAGLAVEHFIVTEREAVEMALDGLADAMEANDKNAAMAFLSPSAVQTRAQAEWAFNRFEVQNVSISNLEIEVNDLTSPPSAQARFNGFIQVHDRRGEFPYNAQNFYFILDFRKEGGRWLVTAHKEKFASLVGPPKSHDHEMSP